MPPKTGGEPSRRCDPTTCIEIKLVAVGRAIPFAAQCGRIPHADIEILVGKADVVDHYRLVVEHGADLPDVFRAELGFPRPYRTAISRLNSLYMH